MVEIKTEFRGLLDFDERSFAEIDAKARYWLMNRLSALGTAEIVRVA